MYLTAITQRERLFELAMRWLQGCLEADDGRFLTFAFLLDEAITAPVVTDFLRDVIAPTSPVTKIEPLRLKAQVRSRIARACSAPSSRAGALLAQFHSCPERFYPTTPVDMLAVDGCGRELLAMVRFKSIPRIVDKVSRRATTRFESEIRRRAEAITVLQPSAGDGLGDGVLAEAERLVCADLARGCLSFSRQDLLIGDLIGVKLIGDPVELAQFEARVVSHPQVVSVRRSEHHGNYKDTRLEVELACPAPATTVERLLAREWHTVSRGVEEGELRRAIPDYVESGEKTFFVEVILTTWEDLVESEFGRGLHEERTVRQRGDLRWARQLPANVALTMMALMLVAIAPTTEVGELPIKLTGRYLPDSMTTIISRLFGVDVDRSPLWVAPTSPRALRAASYRQGSDET